MADNETSLSKVTPEAEVFPAYMPSLKDMVARNVVMKDFIDGRSIINKSYAQFNERNLYDTIDDWTKRWNGYVPPQDALLDMDQSRMFLNFTRNQIISYLAKIGLQRPSAHIKAVNKKSGVPDKKLSEVLEDLNRYSLDAENGEARFLDAALECVTKGTVIVYEGYRREEQEMQTPLEFDAVTGEIKTKKEKKIIYDDCFQQVVPLEDFYIANPYEPDVQKQPFVIWRQITAHSTASSTFGKYPNWKYVKPGAYTLEADPTTFYRNKIVTDLTKDQAEIVRYYNRKKGKHIIMANGVILYNGAFPFKDGMYPFARGIFEPFEVSFFWGMGFPQKIMGEQDMMNTFWNMMADKTFASLLPYGLSSDLDDLIEDDMLQANKIRKVSDINKWKFDNLPGVTPGEEHMLQTAIAFARENSGNMTGTIVATPQGGKVSARQALMQQQEAMQRLGFSMSYMEDFEVERTRLRLNHILQFYSIPKLEKITNSKGKEIEKMLFRDIRLMGVKLPDGKMGNKVIKLVDGVKNEDDKKQLQDDLAVQEASADIQGQPTQFLALDISTLFDYNMSVSIVRNSSYQRNETLDQASRREYFQFRVEAAQLGVPADMNELVKYVDEAFDVDSSRFEPKQGQPTGAQPPNPGEGPGGDPQAQGKAQDRTRNRAGPVANNNPSKMTALTDKGM